MHCRSVCCCVTCGIGMFKNCDLGMIYLKPKIIYNETFIRSRDGLNTGLNVEVY